MLHGLASTSHTFDLIAPILARRFSARQRRPQPGERQFVEARRQPAVMVPSLEPRIRFRRIDGVHDVHLQCPLATARLVAGFVDEVGVAGS